MATSPGLAEEFRASCEVEVDDWEALDDDGGGDEPAEEERAPGRPEDSSSSPAGSAPERERASGAAAPRVAAAATSLLPAARQSPSVFVNKVVVREAPAGRARPSAPSLAFCEVMYEGRLLLSPETGETGGVFDSSYETGIPYVAEVGGGKVIRAWEMVLPTMCVGERCRLQCSSEFAYGAAGSPPDIPPGAALEFEMELVGVRRQRSSAALVHAPPPATGGDDGGSDDPAARLAKLREGRAAEAERRRLLAEKKEEAKRLAAERLANKGAKKGGKSSKKRGK